MPDERVHIQTFSNPALKDRFLQTIQQRLVRDLAKARPDKIRQEKTHHEERVQLPKYRLVQPLWASKLGRGSDIQIENCGPDVKV